MCSATARTRPPARAAGRPHHSGSAPRSGPSARALLALNVTDGDSTDGDPSPDVAHLAKQVARGGGTLLMTNIHISSDGGDPIVFPGEDDYRRLDANGRMLFETASPVPPSLAEKLRTKPGARMMAYNAAIEDLARVFEAGSSVAAR